MWYQLPTGFLVNSMQTNHGNLKLGVRFVALKNHCRYCKRQIFMVFAHVFGLKCCPCVFFQFFAIDTDPQTPSFHKWMVGFLPKIGLWDYHNLLVLLGAFFQSMFTLQDPILKKHTSWDLICSQFLIVPNLGIGIPGETDSTYIGP